MNSEQENMQFDEELMFKRQNNETSSLDSMEEVGSNQYEAERQTSIEKLVNDVLIPPLSASNGADSKHSVSPPLNISDVDLSNISPLSSIQAHAPNSNHPYFSSLDNHQNVDHDHNKSKNDSCSTSVSLGKMKPINISNTNKGRIHYSNTPNILTSEYASEYGQKSFNASMVKDDLYYLEYSRSRDFRPHHVDINDLRRFNSNSSVNVTDLNLNLKQKKSGSGSASDAAANTSGSGGGNNQSRPHQLMSPHQLSGGGVAGRHHHHYHHQQQQHHHHHQIQAHHLSRSPSRSHSHSHHNTPQQQSPNTSNTAATTPHSSRASHTNLHSPHSAHSPHTPHSMNHAFPRFTPYSTQSQAPSQSHPHNPMVWQPKPTPKSSTSTPATTNSSGDSKQADQVEMDKELKIELSCAEKEEVAIDDDNNVSDKNVEQKVVAANGGLSRSKSGTCSVGHSPRSNSSFISSAPRLNYEEEGLSQADVEEVLSQLDIRPDTLRDSSTDFRPVFSCIRPIVCHKSNTPFYAQCSTAKLGYCTWCRQLRRGNQKQGSICLNCGERLTAKYHRWYPHLVRLEPLEKTRTKSMYKRYKPVFERFGITWHNEKQFDFVVDHYMLMKIYLSTENFNIEPLHLERTYMIGVFAGREFNTGALARKLLREGTKLAMFRADFPEYYDFLRDERAAVAEQMNLRFFQGVYKCYFHAHYTNIEGWYDPSVISRESIIETFKELCNTILAHTALAHINQTQDTDSKQKQQSKNKQQQNKQIKNKNNNNNNHKALIRGGHQSHHQHQQHHHQQAKQQQQHQHHQQHHHHRHQQQQQQQQQQQSLISQLQQQTPMINMIQNGMMQNGVNLNMMNLNAINQMNGLGNIPPLNLVSSTNGNQQQHQQQQQQADDHQNNQLLAATQSMLNGIASSMPPPPSMLNPLSVTNMAAITPIAKVKTFQFNAPHGTASTPQSMRHNHSHNQISPQYLPPLATTPRFTVPTPRGTPSTQTYTAINLNNMGSITNPLSSMNASSPLQANASNPSSVSMLSTNGSLQIPTSMLKNTNVAHKKKENVIMDKKKNMNINKKDDKQKKKDSLNAGAPPFLLNTSGVISPPISPRNFNRTRNHFVPPPPPQSFAFPPQTANWLPVPPVLSATTPTNAAQSMPMNNMNGINQISIAHHQHQQQAMQQQHGQQQQQQQHQQQQQQQQQAKGSPLFTPSQSPTFHPHPFSH